MSGAGAGVFVRVLLVLWYWGSGRPMRWLVTIAGELLSFSFGSATNSSAVRTKPATARNARAGISTFLLYDFSPRQKAKSGRRAASSYDVVSAVQLDLTSDEGRECVRCPIIRAKATWQLRSEVSAFVPLADIPAVTMDVRFRPSAEQLIQIKLARTKTVQ